MWYTKYIVHQDELLNAKSFSREYINFRRRFRLPPRLWIWIVGHMRRYFPDRPLCTGKPCIPLELKVLGVLRHLARDTTCDCIAEITGYSQETHRKFMMNFLRQFVEHFHSDWLKPPEMGSEELKRSEGEYSLSNVSQLSRTVSDQWYTRLHCQRRLRPHRMVHATLEQ